MDLFGENDLMHLDTRAVAGVDEVGRGPLAGPVVAAAVVLEPSRAIADLRDSKQLTSRQRASLAEAIRERSHAWALGRAEVAEIDRLNILRASLLAMRRDIFGLGVAQYVTVTGWRLADFPEDAQVCSREDFEWLLERFHFGRGDQHLFECRQIAAHRPGAGCAGTGAVGTDRDAGPGPPQRQR